MAKVNGTQARVGAKALRICMAVDSIVISAKIFWVRVKLWRNEVNFKRCSAWVGDDLDLVMHVFSCSSAHVRSLSCFSISGLPTQSSNDKA